MAAAVNFFRFTYTYYQQQPGPFAFRKHFSCSASRTRKILVKSISISCAPFMNEWMMSLSWNLIPSSKFNYSLLLIVYLLPIYCHRQYITDILQIRSYFTEKMCLFSFEWSAEFCTFFLVKLQNSELWVNHFLCWIMFLSCYTLFTFLHIQFQLRSSAAAFVESFFLPAYCKNI